MGAYANYRDQLSKDFDNAAKYGKIDEINSFLANSDIDSIDRNSAFNISIENGQFEAVKLLFKYHKDDFNSSNKYFAYAIKSSNFNTIDFIYSNYKDHIIKNMKSHSLIFCIKNLENLYLQDQNSFFHWYKEIKNNFKCDQTIFSISLYSILREKQFKNNANLDYINFLFHDNKLDLNFSLKLSEFDQIPKSLSNHIKQLYLDPLIYEKLNLLFVTNNNTLNKNTLSL